MLYLFGPWAFCEIWIQDLGPSVQALDLCLPGQELSNQLPVPSVQPLYCLAQKFVLFKMQKTVSAKFKLTVGAEALTSSSVHFAFPDLDLVAVSTG